MIYLIIKIIKMTENKKKFIRWFAKEIKFENWGSVIGLTLNLDQLNALPVDNYGNIKIDVCQKREPDQWWNTHYVIENTYWQNKGSKDRFTDNDNSEELPF